jgi:RNA-directed DNA polymerase
MKRHGNLWPQLIDFSNLLQAARKAQRGKRFRDNVLSFNYHLETELLNLQADLQNQTYIPGRYTTFEIKSPKPRMISAAPYRDRVVHHALCAIIGPIFDRTFIHDSYANRVGFGSHRALRRFAQFMRSSRYILQADIRKYFPCIDHEILKSLIRRKIKCRQTLWLIDQIIDHSNPQEIVDLHLPGDDLLTPLSHRRGLPIGNLTSQFFANIYLNDLDHFCKEELYARKYLRYVDDFALFSNDPEYLADARLEIEDYLATNLRLKIHPIKSQQFETRHGANFVGFRVIPTQDPFPRAPRIRVSQESLKRGRIRLRQQKAAYSNHSISSEAANKSLQSWFAHLNHGDTWQLQQQISGPLDFFEAPEVG